MTFSTRLRTRLLSAALMLLVFSISVSSIAQDTANPALMSSYRGSMDKVLAQTPWGNLSEADLFIYLLMTKQDTPLLYQQYRQAPAGPELDALRARVETAIRNWAVAQALAADAPALSDPLDKIRLRLLEYPVHETVWIDKFLVPQVNVKPEDIRKYINENPEITAQTGKVQVRCLFLKLDPKADTTEVRKVEAQMARLREQIMNGEIAFEDAARKYSQAPSAAEGGLMPEFAAGTHFVALEDQAFALGKGEISPVIYGLDGLYLVQGVSRKDAETVVTQPTEELVKKRLYFTQLQGRYTYELWKLRSKANALNKAAVIDTINSKATALKANKLKLTRDQVWSLFPEFSGQDFVINKALLGALVDRTISLELISQYNEKKKMGWDPALASARQLALVILKAQNRLIERARQEVPADPDQLREYIRQHETIFRSAMGTPFSLVQVRLVDEKKLSVARRKWELERMRKAMEGLRDSYSANTLAETAAQWKGRETSPVELIPKRIADELSRQADESTEIICWHSTKSDQVLSKKTREMVNRLKAELPKRAAAKERFLPVIEDDKSLTLFYIEQPDWTDANIIKVNNFSLQQAAARFAAGEVLEKIKAEQLSSGQLTIQLAQ